MLSKTLFIACAAMALMAGSALAQEYTPLGPLNDPTRLQVSPSSPNTVNPLPTVAPVGTQTNVSVNVRDLPANAVVVTELVTNGPVPDTAENRARYGQPQSHAGKLTRPAGN